MDNIKTEGKTWTSFVNALRQLNLRYCQNRKQAEKNARVAPATYCCATCGAWIYTGKKTLEKANIKAPEGVLIKHQHKPNGQVIKHKIDHIRPFRALDGRRDIFKMFNMLFSEIDNYQVLCNDCHSIKTKIEGEIRRAIKKDVEYWVTMPSLPSHEANFQGEIRVKKTGRLLKGTDNGYGYIRFSINKKTRYLHRLIAETYLSDYSEDLQVNHIDGNKENNHILNLEMVTSQENMTHITKLRQDRPKFTFKENIKCYDIRFRYKNELCYIGMYEAEYLEYGYRDYWNKFLEVAKFEPWDSSLNDTDIFSSKVDMRGRHKKYYKEKKFGVSKHSCGKYQVRFNYNKTHVWVGLFDTKEEGYIQLRLKFIELYGIEPWRIE